MTEFKNVSLSEYLKIATAVGDQHTFVYGTVTGSIAIDGNKTELSTTYPELNQMLRGLSFQIAPTHTDDVEIVLSITDEFGNDHKQTQTVVVSELTPTSVQEEVTRKGGEDGDEDVVELVAILQPHTIACDIQVTDVFGTLSLEHETQVAMVKVEAGRRIDAMIPAWKQSNAQTRMIELLEVGKDKWSATEKAEVEAIRQGFAAIKAVRTKSDEIEALKNIPLDVWNDEHWTA